MFRFIDIVLRAMVQSVLPMCVQQANQMFDEAGLFAVAFSTSWFVLSAMSNFLTWKLHNRFLLHPFLFATLSTCHMLLSQVVNWLCHSGPQLSWFPELDVVEQRRARSLPCRGGRRWERVRGRLHGRGPGRQCECRRQRHLRDEVRCQWHSPMDVATGH